MSADSVDDLHAAEDLVGQLRSAIEHLQYSWDTQSSSELSVSLEQAMELALAPYCRPTCGAEGDINSTECGDDTCGCPCDHNDVEIQPGHFPIMDAPWPTGQ